MREIQLTPRGVALVDDEDYVWLSRHKWKAKRYNNKTGKFMACRNVTVNKRSEFLAMHRAIVGVTDPKIKVDHHDRDGLNNQRYNLRKANSRQNNTNRDKQQGTSSKYKGVSRRSSETYPWSSYITFERKRRHIGVFDCEIKAALAYNIEALKLHGEFAALNVVDDPQYAGLAQDLNFKGRRIG